MDITRYRFHVALLLTVVAGIMVFDVFFNSHGTGHNMITGNSVVSSKVSVVPAPLANCSIELHQGWNLISVYCLGMLVDKGQALESISGNYASVFYYDPMNTDDHWKSYNPDIPSWAVQDLEYMNRVNGYWIYIKNDTTYFYSGARKDSTIVLYPGWNLIGYPSNTSRPINTTLDITFTIIKEYDDSSGEWKTYSPASSANTLVMLSTYEGYWIKVPSQQLLQMQR